MYLAIPYKKKITRSGLSPVSYTYPEQRNKHSSIVDPKSTCVNYVKEKCRYHALATIVVPIFTFSIQCFFKVAKIPILIEKNLSKFVQRVVFLINI